MDELALVVAAALALVACGGDQPAPAGASSSSGGPDAGGCVPGELASEDGGCHAAGVGACAEGFVADEAAGCVAVLPASPCAAGTLALLGETACHEVAPCPQGTWGAIPVDADTEHVDVAYTGGNSDGSAASPWTSIQAAVDAAATGAVVAIAAGTYNEDLQVYGVAVRLWGRCPGLVEIAGVGDATSVLLVYGPAADGTEIHDLAVTTGAALPQFGIAVDGAEGVIVDRVLVHDTTAPGFYIDASTGTTSVDVARTLVEGARDVGFYSAGAEVTVEDTLVRGSLPGLRVPGRGVEVVYELAAGRRGVGTFRRLVVDGNRQSGINVSGSDATIEATLVTGTLPDSSQVGGYGVHAQDTLVDGALERAVVTATGVVVTENHEYGVSIVGSDATLESLVVRDTIGSAASYEGGYGVVFAESATGGTSTGSLRASLVAANRHVGVVVVASQADLEGVRVRDTKPLDDGSFGVGLQIQSSDTVRAGATLRGSVIEGSHTAGVMLLGGDATFEGTLVRGTAARSSDGAFGDGIVIVSDPVDATATIVGGRIESNARAGVLAVGAVVQVGASALECNAIALDAEPLLTTMVPATFDDLGGNTCGCAGVEASCKVLSSNLEAPPALPPP